MHACIHAYIHTCSCVTQLLYPVVLAVADCSDILVSSLTRCLLPALTGSTQRRKHLQGKAFSFVLPSQPPVGKLLWAGPNGPIREPSLAPCTGLPQTPDQRWGPLSTSPLFPRDGVPLLGICRMGGCGSACVPKMLITPLSGQELALEYGSHISGQTSLPLHLPDSCIRAGCPPSPPTPLNPLAPASAPPAPGRWSAGVSVASSVLTPF